MIATKPFLVLVSLALAACATRQAPLAPYAAKGPPTKPQQARECKTGSDYKCSVVVNVKFDSQSRPFLEVDDPSWFLYVTRNREHRITWTLSVSSPGKTGDFAFDATKGIDFDLDTPHRTYVTCNQARDTPYCTVKHAGAAHTVYKYTISVVDVSGVNTVYPLDPWVVAE